MKYLIGFTLLVLCLSSKAQQNASFLIGSWKVTDVTLPKDASDQDKEVLNILKPNLLKASFKFDAGGKGKFKVPMDNIPMEKGSLPPEDVLWTYSPAKQYVTITDQSELKSRIAELYVKIEDGHTYFLMEGAPVITLKVMKY